MIPVRAWALVAVLVLSAPGCGGVPLEEASPGGFDLSGHWVLIQEESGGSPVRGASIRSGFLAQDFPLLVTGEMRIEQDARSMGIEYGRGSYRDVTWGERKRGVWDVRAGWHDGALHIYSKAPDTSASEIWELSEDGRRLEINIGVRGTRDHDFRRVFRRSPGV